MIHSTISVSGLTLVACASPLCAQPHDVADGDYWRTRSRLAAPEPDEDCDAPPALPVSPAALAVPASELSDASEPLDDTPVPDALASELPELGGGASAHVPLLKSSTPVSSWPVPKSQ